MYTESPGSHRWSVLIHHASTARNEPGKRIEKRRVELYIPMLMGCVGCWSSSLGVVSSSLEGGEVESVDGGDDVDEGEDVVDVVEVVSDEDILLFFLVVVGGEVVDVESRQE